MKRQLALITVLLGGSMSLAMISTSALSEEPLVPERSGRTKATQVQPGLPFRSISPQQYVDKVHGGWAGKMIGLVLGAPTEFRVPWPPPEVTFYDDEVARLDYYPDISGDDVYINLIYLFALEEHGLDVSSQQLGEAIRSNLTQYHVWCASREAYLNMEAGVAPPHSGEPLYNEWFWSLDAQIENDVWGFVAPGMSSTAAEYATRGASVTNWADGKYGAAFMAAAVSEAFFCDDVEQIVRAALKVIPQSSGYAGMVRDCLQWHKQIPDWRDARQTLGAKYDKLPYDKWTANLNSGVVILSLLYGAGDFDETITMAMKMGWDSDCNPSSAGGVLGVMLGASGIPEKWRKQAQGVERWENVTLFHYPPYLDVADIARRTAAMGEKLITAKGGKVTVDRVDIPVETPRILPLEKMTPGEAGELRESKKDLTDSLKESRANVYTRLAQRWLDSWNEGWSVSGAAEVRLLAGNDPPRKIDRIYINPSSDSRMAVLEKDIRLAANKRHVLTIAAAPAPNNKQRRVQLRVIANGKLVDDAQIDKDNAWQDTPFDLSEFAGQEIHLRLEQVAADESPNSGAMIWRSLSCD